MALIFVVGTGRCGSSTVARLLHENSIACMGHLFKPGDQGNPKGYFEDKSTKVALRWLIENKTTTKGLIQALKKCHGNCKVLGVKNPVLVSKITKQQWEELKPLHVFWADRKREQIIYSLQHCRDWRQPTTKRSRAQAVYESRYQGLLEGLKGVPAARITKIDFSEPRTDSWVLNEIKEGLRNA